MRNIRLFVLDRSLWLLVEVLNAHKLNKNAMGFLVIKQVKTIL
jgi:hypothetical protein